MAFEKVQSGQEFNPPSAFEWNAMLQAGQNTLAGQTGISARESGVMSPQACVVRIKNMSGGDRDRYECVTLGAPRWQLAAKHILQGIVMAGTVAAEDSPPAVLLQPLKEDHIGFAVCLGPAILRMNTFSGSAKLFAAPNANGKFDSADSGPIRLISATSGQYGFGVIGFGPGSTPSEHYLFTLTGTISAGAGAATIRNMADDDEIETGASVKDPLGHFAGLTSGYRGVCVKSGGEYYVLSPWVKSVTWSDPTLSYDRTNGPITIDTATTCP